MLEQKDVKNMKCAPCSVDTPPLSGSVLSEYLAILHEDWVLSDNQKIIRRSFQFKDFVSAVAFITQVANIAESEGHHPDYTWKISA